jgi:hypothetical protein
MTERWRGCVDHQSGNSSERAGLDVTVDLYYLKSTYTCFIFIDLAFESLGCLTKSKPKTEREREREREIKTVLDSDRRSYKRLPIK